MKIWGIGGEGKYSSSAKPQARLSFRGTGGHVGLLLLQLSVTANDWWVVIHFCCSAVWKKNHFISASYDILCYEKSSFYKLE